MDLLADVFVTIKPSPKRMDLTIRSIESLLKSVDRDQIRLTACFDGIDDAIDEYVEISGSFYDQIDHYVISRENIGLGQTINKAVSLIKTVNEWFSDDHVGDPSKVSSVIVMCQDDLLYEQGWLLKLLAEYRTHRPERIGFATGLECVEHPIRRAVNDRVILKDWIRASQMMADHDYWYSLMPIPAFDPETGSMRGRPNDGLGSGVDWWMIRNHENSVCRTGRTCLVMPGLVRHIGYDRSTWLGRELPESEVDKEMMK